MTRSISLLGLVLLVGGVVAARGADDEKEKKKPDPAPPAERRAGKAEADERYALAMAVSGKVEVDGVAGRRKLAVRDVLSVGDLLLPAEGARALLLSRDGRSESVTVPSELGLDADLDAPASPLFVAALSEVERLARGLAVRDGDGGRTRSAAPGAADGAGVPEPTSPRARLLDARPRFAWADATAAEGTAYTITIVRVERDAAGGRVEKPVLTAQAAGRSWELPADRADLEPGLHRWQVASADGRRSEQALFLVLDADQRAAIAAARDAYATAAAAEEDEAFRHVLMACFYRQDGVHLLEEARRELKAALEADPAVPLAEAMLEATEHALGRR